MNGAGMRAMSCPSFCRVFGVLYRMKSLQLQRAQEIPRRSFHSALLYEQLEVERGNFDPILQSVFDEPERKSYSLKRKPFHFTVEHYFRGQIFGIHDNI